MSFSSDHILESYRESNERFREMQRQKTEPMLNRYLVIEGDEVPLSTNNWEMYFPTGLGRLDKVIDLQLGKFTTDGINWGKIEIE